MLAFFILRTTFYKLRMTLTVDAEARNASLTITYDRRIVNMGDVPYHKVCNLHKAELWFKESPSPDYATRAEYLEAMHKRIAA